MVDITTIVTPNGYDVRGLHGDMAGSNRECAWHTHDATHFDAINISTGHTFHLIGTGYAFVDGFTGSGWRTRSTFSIRRMAPRW